MLSDEVIDKLVERLVNRIEEGNTYIIKKIGESIKKIGTLTPTKAQQLINILKYGGDYDKIVKKLAKITNLNVKDIYAIFEEVAKKETEFAKQFYDYRGKKFIPFDENKQLQEQVKALAKITANEYINLTKTTAFASRVGNKLVYTEVGKKYQEVLDKAVLSISQGKESFGSEMRKVIKELAESGIRTVDYESGRSMRVDSAVRMQMKGALRNLHNEMQQQFGEEFDSDGVEISVHLNPAPDHAEVQGRQFSNKEFEKFQNDQDSIDYKGKLFPAEFEGHDRRSISQYNCYHYVFSIVLGVSEPRYDDKELQQIIDDNNKGFDFDGKHYTNYEGTQLQRQLELAIRKQKDIQIGARAVGDNDLIRESQQKITALTNKYKELSKESGLSAKMKRMQVSGYKRISLTANNKPIYDFTKYRNIIDNTKTLPTLEETFDYENFIKEYNKFYNSLDKNEVKDVYNEYEKWCQLESENVSQPIGKFLNKKNGYDAKPQLIDEKEFWIDEDGEPVAVGDTVLLDKNHWYRGVSEERYSNVLKTKVPDIEKTKEYVNDFKNGDYYAGIGLNGNGTYATEEYSYATRYSRDIEEGIIYLMPKDNAKIVTIDKINYIKYNIIRELPDKDDLYTNFSKAMLGDNGYLAELLGYDIIDIGEHKIILNRGSIKVVK